MISAGVGDAGHQSVPDRRFISLNQHRGHRFVFSPLRDKKKKKTMRAMAVLIDAGGPRFSTGAAGVVPAHKPRYIPQRADAAQDGR